MKSPFAAALVLSSLLGLCACGDGNSTGAEPGTPGDVPDAPARVLPDEELGEEAAKLLAEARRYLAEGDMARAMFATERFRKIEPDHVPGLLLHGELAEHYRMFDVATEHYERVLGFDDACAAAYLGRGRCHAELGELESALEDMRHAEKLAPGECEVDLRAWRHAVNILQQTTGETHFDLLSAEIVAIRGLPFEKDVPRTHQRLDEFGERTKMRLDAALGDSTREDAERGLRRLGLLRGDIDLVQEQAEALMSLSAAYYDEEKDVLVYLAEDLPYKLVEWVTIGESVHALQDQHLDLERYLARAAPREGSPRNDDLSVAIRSIPLGEARYVKAVWYAQQFLDVAPEGAFEMAQFVASAAASAEDELLMMMARFVADEALKQDEDHPINRAMARMESMPKYVLLPPLTAEFYGVQLISNVHRQGGWAGVAKLYENPPDSTEQCLHPEKLEGNRDRPTSLTLPVLAEFEAEGFRRIDAAVHGELYLRVLLDELGLPSPDARVATEGWDGDIYAAYARGKDVAVALATTWDTKADASEFYEAYRSVLSAKYPELATEVITGGGDVHLFDCGPGLGTGGLRLRDREVFAVEGVSKVLRSRLLARLGQMDIEHVD